jgi:hypothetical protein
MIEDFIVVETTSGALQAEILRGLLESRGVRVMLSQEAAAKSIGLSIGPLGDVDILVPQDQEDLARDILVQYHSGTLEDES